MVRDVDRRNGTLLGTLLDNVEERSITEGMHVLRMSHCWFRFLGEIDVAFPRNEIEAIAGGFVGNVYVLSPCKEK